MNKRDIEKFFKDVERLALKSPNATIMRKTGYGKSTISTYLNGVTEPSEAFIKKFYEKFGESLNELDGTTEDKNPTFQQRLNALKNSDGGVPVLGGSTNLGPVIVYDDNNERHEVIAELPRNLFPGCDFAEKAKGDSMYPLIMNQALLVGKTCPVEGIVLGEKYIIKTKDGLDTAKYVHSVLDENKKRVPGKLCLVAYNKSVPSQEVDIETINFACRIMWIINPT